MMRARTREQTAAEVSVAGPVAGTPGAQDRARGRALAPRGVHDLRAGHDAEYRAASAPHTLRYPPGDVVLISGLPGSGKSTLLRRTVTDWAGSDRVGPEIRVLDSEHVRGLFAARLPGWLPYRAYRVAVRAAHYARLARAARTSRALVVHDCGTLSLVRAALTRHARRTGRRTHLVLLDVSARDALEGQRARGRVVSRHAFRRHQRATSRLLAAALDAARRGTSAHGCASFVLLDRDAAETLRLVTFR